MAKSPARLNDQSSHSSHGQGTVVVTEPTTMTFEGLPPACEGDLMQYPDGFTGVIPPGNACVVVNGRRLALLGDGNSGNGNISTCSSSIQVAEGEPRVFIGNNVFIGPNVFFGSNSQSEPSQSVFNQHFQFYDQKTGELMNGINYFIKTPTQGVRGISSPQAKTVYVMSNQAQEAELQILPQMEILIT